MEDLKATGQGGSGEGREFLGDPAGGGVSVGEVDLGEEPGGEDEAGDPAGGLAGVVAGDRRCVHWDRFVEAELVLDEGGEAGVVDLYAAVLAPVIEAADEHGVAGEIEHRAGAEGREGLAAAELTGGDRALLG